MSLCSLEHINERGKDKVRRRREKTETQRMPPKARRGEAKEEEGIGGSSKRDAVRAGSRRGARSAPAPLARSSHGSLKASAPAEAGGPGGEGRGEKCWHEAEAAAPAAALPTHLSRHPSLQSQPTRNSGPVLMKTPLPGIRSLL